MSHKHTPISPLDSCYVLCFGRNLNKVCSRDLQKKEENIKKNIYNTQMTRFSLVEDIKNENDRKIYITA